MSETYAVLLFSLARRWRWLLAGAVAAMVITGAILLLLPANFETTVNVVPTRARTEVDYGTRIRTASSEGIGQQTALPPATAERRQALAQMAHSVEIERVVQERLADVLPPELKTPGELLKRIESQVIPRSEMIAIRITAPSAALAQQVASTWAEVYETQVNQLYGATPAEALTLETEIASVRQKYEAAESALTSFLATSTLPEQQRSLEYRQQLLAELLAVQQAQVIDLHKVAHRLDLLIDQAEALRQQLELATDSGAAASTSAAITLLKAQAFASSMTAAASLQVQMPAEQVGPRPPSTTTQDNQPGIAASARSLQDWTLPSGLQLQVPSSATPVSIAAQRADVAALLQALQAWRERLGQEIDSRTVSGDGSVVATANAGELGRVIAGLEAEIRELQGQIADQSAQQRRLQQGRDVTWESYTSILKKTEEASVARVIGSGKEVAIAGQTFPEPVDRHAPLLLPLAALLGLSLSAGLVALYDLGLPAYRRALTTLNGGAVGSAPINGSAGHVAEASREHVAP